MRRRAAVSFRGGSVVITGGSRGLGLELARQLGRAGARLTILARDLEGLERAAGELQALGTDVLALGCDVREPSEVKRTVAEVIGRRGAIDVLINNAGVIEWRALEEIALGEVGDAIGVHFWGPLLLMREVFPHMRRRGGGRIVNVAAIEGKIGVPMIAAYAASKFALVGLSDSVRAEWARYGIVVTTVIPGLMRTGDRRTSGAEPASRAGAAAQSVSGPPGRLARLATAPLVSISAERAAARIIRACRRGDPQLVFPLAARLAIVLEALFPHAFARLAIRAARGSTAAG